MGCIVLTVMAGECIPIIVFLLSGMCCAGYYNCLMHPDFDICVVRDALCRLIMVAKYILIFGVVMLGMHFASFYDYIAHPVLAVLQVWDA